MEITHGKMMWGAGTWPRAGAGAGEVPGSPPWALDLPSGVRNAAGGDVEANIRV